LSRNESVDVLRKKIDQIDAKIVNLLNARASLAQHIGHSKSLTSQEVYVPNREKEILQQVSELNRGPLPTDAIRSVFREIISGCRSLEARLNVAFFGAEATYSHLAAKEKFGSSAELRSTASIAEVFQEVSQGRASFGVVPIENSTEGVVAHTLDCLVESDCKFAPKYIWIFITSFVQSRQCRRCSTDLVPPPGAGTVPWLADGPISQESPWKSCEYGPCANGRSQ
jgi:chorismate mutase/prephenate dehydratase